MLEKCNDSLEEKASITENESEFMQDSLRDQLNGSLEAIFESPVKPHGMPRHRRLSYANAKFDKTATAIKQRISSVIGASATEVSLPSEVPSGLVAIEQNCQRFRSGNGIRKKSSSCFHVLKKDATSDTNS